MRAQGEDEVRGILRRHEYTHNMTQRREKDRHLGKCYITVGNIMILLALLLCIGRNLIRGPLPFNATL